MLFAGFFPLNLIFVFEKHLFRREILSRIFWWTSFLTGNTNRKRLLSFHDHELFLADKQTPVATNNFVEKHGYDHRHPAKIDFCWKGNWTYCEWKKQEFARSIKIPSNIANSNRFNWSADWSEDRQYRRIDYLDQRRSIYDDFCIIRALLAWRQASSGCQMIFSF